MKRYEKYKEVDLPWLKEVPEHWETLKIQNITECKSSNLTTSDILKVGRYRVYDANKIVGFSNIGINERYISIIKDGAGIGRVRKLSPNTNILTTMNALIPKNIYYDFLYYILTVFDFEIYNTSTTIPHIYYSEYSKCYVPIPPLKEQIQIANFLDWKISEIDRLIELEKSKVEKLEEYKKNIFSSLMKNEKEYKVISLKNILKIKNIKKSQIDRELNLLSVVRDKGIILRSLDEEDENHNVIPEDLSNYKVVYKNDFVMNKMKAWQGSYGISKLEGVVSPAYFVFDFKNKDILKDFFHLSIRCREYIDEFAKYSKGIRVGQWDFDLKEIKNIYFKYPSLDRQNYIMDKVKGSVKYFV